jgi:SET and MYND domain-containing protein 4
MTMKSLKNVAKADTLRNEGNKSYAERKFLDALVKYNESLCHAPPNSESLGLAFANKSAVYFEMKLFEECLKNIDNAKAHKYPAQNYGILERRAQKCREMSKQKMKFPNPWEFFKLSYKRNEKLPFIVEGLEVKQSEKYGRHIVTSRPLKVGDVLAIEEPFCSVLLSQSQFVEVDKQNKFQRCANCLRDVKLDLMPCWGCCEGTE